MKEKDLTLQKTFQVLAAILDTSARTNNSPHELRATSSAKENVTPRNGTVVTTALPA